MGDSPPDLESPTQQPSSRRSSQVLQPRSQHYSQSQPTDPSEVQQIPLHAQPRRSSQEIPESRTSLQDWSQGASPSQHENLTMFQAQEAPLGGIKYPPQNMVFTSDVQPQHYLDEGRIQAARQASLMQQLQQGHSSLFQQLESAHQEPQSDLLGQFNMYQREDLQSSQGAQHGPYMRDDPALQFTPSEPCFLPFRMEVLEPEPQELAVQNAKAYLLQTGGNCNLSL